MVDDLRWNCTKFNSLQRSEALRIQVDTGGVKLLGSRRRALAALSRVAAVLAVVLVPLVLVLVVLLPLLSILDGRNRKKKAH